MKRKHWKIYLLIVDNQVYIGLTRYPLQHRKRMHILHSLANTKKHNAKVNKAIRNAPNNVEIKQLCECKTELEGRKKEIYYIRQYSKTSIILNEKLLLTNRYKRKTDKIADKQERKRIMKTNKLNKCEFPFMYISRYKQGKDLHHKSIMQALRLGLYFYRCK